METRIYGILDNNDCLIDVSLSLKAAKRYATLNGYNKVGYRVGYNAFVLCEKVGTKWINLETI